MPEINFEKMRMLANIFRTVSAFKSTKYNFSFIDPNLKEWVESKWVVLAESELYKRAKLYEQPAQSFGHTSASSYSSNASLFDLFQGSRARSNSVR